MEKNKNNDQNKENKDFGSRCYGIIVVKSQHSNFNADFSGFPRRLPDNSGTIYATDKALKYAIRRYWVDKGQNVFVWKGYIEKDNKFRPMSINEKFNLINKESKTKPKKIEIIDTLLSCLDVRCFGTTFAAANENISICGPVQLSYGINRYIENSVYSNQILSPFNPNEKEQSTIGSETKAMESHYVFDFVINPKNLYDHFQGSNFPKLTDNDITLLKEAMCKGVTNLNSASKIGSENELVLFITLNENSLLQLPTFKSLVRITKENEKYKIDLSEIFKYLNKYKNGNNVTNDNNSESEIKSIEAYYNSEFVEIKVKIDGLIEFDLNLNSTQPNK